MKITIHLPAGISYCTNTSGWVNKGNYFRVIKEISEVKKWGGTRGKIDCQKVYLTLSRLITRSQIEIILERKICMASRGFLDLLRLG